MKITIDPNVVWYHGSDQLFDTLRTGSTVTQWQALAEAFCTSPRRWGYDNDGTILHNGTAQGYLYIIDEPVVIGEDLYQHPRTTMDVNAEFLTTRPIKVRQIKIL